MRKFIPILLMILSLPLCGKAEQGYVIDGNVTEIPDGTVMYLRLVGPPTKDIDSTRIENGRFRFTGVHNGTPEWALISIKGAFLPACDFYLENGNIEINGTRYSCTATGTETNSQYNYFKTNINSIFTDISNTHMKIATPGKSQESIDSIKMQIKVLEREVLDKEIKFIHDYPDSPVSLRIVEYICRDASSDNILRYVSYLSEKQQATPAVASLKDYASRKKRTENGALAPTFTLPDLNGTDVSLADYRGKYVLVDFWASWCAPCRASFPKVKKLYTKYAGERFEILGVSLDQSKKAWLKAVGEEDCPWTQVIDRDGDVARNYAVSTIPKMILISPDGTICEYDSIEEKLAGLFGSKD